jgi:ribosome modulation factor
MSDDPAIAEAFSAGVNAHTSGAKVADCPYPNRNPLRLAWLDGWHEADALDEDDDFLD